MNLITPLVAGAGFAIAGGPILSTVAALGTVGRVLLTNVPLAAGKAAAALRAVGRYFTSTEPDFLQLWYVVPGDNWCKFPRYRAPKSKTNNHVTHVLRTVGYDRHVQRYFCFDVGLFFGMESKHRQARLSRGEPELETLVPNYTSLNAFATGTNFEGGQYGVYDRIMFYPNNDTLPEYNFGFMLYLIPVLGNLIHNMSPANTLAPNKYFEQFPAVKDPLTKVNLDWKWLLEPRSLTTGTGDKGTQRHRKLGEYDVFYSMDLYTYNNKIGEKIKQGYEQLDRTPVNVTKKLKLIGYIPKEATFVKFTEAMEEIVDKGTTTKMETIKKEVTSGINYDVAVYHASMKQTDNFWLTDLSESATHPDQTDLQQTSKYNNGDYFTTSWNGIFGTLTVLKVNDEMKNDYRFNSKELSRLAIQGAKGEGLLILQKKYPALTGVSKSKYVTLSLAQDNKPKTLFTEKARTSDNLLNQGSVTSRSEGYPRYYVTHPSSSQVLVHVLRRVVTGTLLKNTTPDTYYISEIYLFVSKRMHNVTPVLMTSGLRDIITNTAKDTFNNIRYISSLNKETSSNTPILSLVGSKFPQQHQQVESMATIVATPSPSSLPCPPEQQQFTGDAIEGFYERLKGWFTHHQSFIETTSSTSVFSPDDTTARIGQRMSPCKTALLHDDLAISGKVLSRFTGSRMLASEEPLMKDTVCDIIVSKLADDLCLKTLTLGSKVNKLELSSLQQNEGDLHAYIGGLLKFLKKKKNPTTATTTSSEATTTPKKKGFFSNAASKVKKTVLGTAKGIQKLRSGQATRLGKTGLVIQIKKSPEALLTQREKLSQQLERQAEKHAVLTKQLETKTQKKQEVLQKKIALVDKQSAAAAKEEAKKRKKEEAGKEKNEEEETNSQTQLLVEDKESPEEGK